MRKHLAIHQLMSSEFRIQEMAKAQAITTATAASLVARALASPDLLAMLWTDESETKASRQTGINKNFLFYNHCFP